MSDSESPVRPAPFPDEVFELAELAKRLYETARDREFANEVEDQVTLSMLDDDAKMPTPPECVCGLLVAAASAMGGAEGVDPLLIINMFSRTYREMRAWMAEVEERRPT